ncbi:MAG: SDR family NAD(P)-dependent oxidoreductase [Bacillota bacterium]
MKNIFDLTGKVALVTGAAQGIGREIALGYAQFGADVAIADLQADKMQSVKQEIEEIGVKCIAVPVDLGDVSAIYNMVNTVVKELGKLDIMANIAGVNVHKPALEMTEKDWDFVLDINLKSLFFCCQAAAKHMLERGYGRIINMSSSFGIVGFENRSAYAASKAAVSNLTKTLALEWSPRGVNVNAIAPGPVRTPAREQLFSDPAFMSGLLAKLPVKRVATPSDIVGVAVFLASEASSFVTGATILVDGGYCAH